MYRLWRWSLLIFSFPAVLCPCSGDNLARASTSPIFLITERDTTGDRGSGTGFYLQGPSGTWVITANHVVRDAAPHSVFARVGGTRVPLVVAHQDFSSDLAALRAQGELPAVGLRLRTTSAVPEQTATIIGFPIPEVLGSATPTTVHGQVRIAEVTPGGIPGFIVAAPAGPGDSGGPVLDSKNRAIGVVIYARTDNAVAYAVHGLHRLEEYLVVDSGNRNKAK